MRVKTLVILAGVLVGLGMVSLVRHWLQRSRGPDLLLKGTTPDAIVKVEIRQPTQTVTLERVNNRWELKTPVSAPANEQVVKPLLEALTNLAVSGVLTSRPERYEQFQVTDASGTVVQVWTSGSDKHALSKAEGPRAAFIVGKNVTEGSGVYLRYVGGKDVHLAEGLASYHLTRAVKDWRDRTILRLNIPEIERVEFTYAKGKDAKFSLVKTSDTWKAWVEGKPEPAQPVEASNVDSLLATLASLDAEDFSDPPTVPFGGRPPQSDNLTALGLNPPTLTIHLKVKTLETTLSLGTPQPTTNYTPLRKDTVPQVFLIASFKADALHKRLSDFLPRRGRS